MVKNTQFPAPFPPDIPAGHYICGLHVIYCGQKRFCYQVPYSVKLKAFILLPRLGLSKKSVVIRNHALILFAVPIFRYR